MKEVTPIPKAGPKVKTRKGGRARPDEPLALRCEAGFEKECFNYATQRHHRLRRSQGGTDDRENTLDVCDRCHNRIHAYPSLGYEHGYLIRSGGNPT